MAHVWLSWTVSKGIGLLNKARSTRTRDKTTGPRKIEQCADVSETADNLSIGSVVSWVHIIFQRSLQVWRKVILAILDICGSKRAVLCVSSVFTILLHGAWVRRPVMERLWDVNLASLTLLIYSNKWSIQGSSFYIYTNNRLSTTMTWAQSWVCYVNP